MLPINNPTPIDRIQTRLLNLAALFLAIFALAYSLSPAVRARSWQVPLQWDHWLSFVVWLVMFNLVNIQSARRLPERDPYLLPIAALLSGWGMLAIWRLFPGFGLRQALWLLFALGVLIIGMRLPSNLAFLRRYKYVWLTGGLALTALTLLLGTNPSGSGYPHLWLGCCGVYFQPSEPLKLLLIVYLAAYLADRLSFLAPASAIFRRPGSMLPLLGPTLIMIGLALLLLLVQRDLGTASIFLFLYTAIVYLGSGRKRILFAGGLVVALTGIAGYLLFDVVRIRVDAWLNPWLDPSGRSYQIVQSLLAVANGGLLGRGPGLGSPSLVPIPHSDFIFAAIAEESGLIGAVGLILLVALLASRGMRTALYAPDSYRRYLAAGLTVHLAGQSILIIGGNLRLLPLTGVTLPFVSYGGSSLLTSFFSLLILLLISNHSEERPAALIDPRPYKHLETFLLAGLAAAALVAGWWAVYRSPLLLERTDNPRRTIADRFVQRGSILDRNNGALNTTSGEPGNFTRQALYPDLSNILGYTSLVYGQSGLEESLDPYLRGLQGNPGLTIALNRLLYGQPPPGLDVRLSLDLDLQRTADTLLGRQNGAIVLINAGSGEILVMASHPTFNANTLETDWPELVQDQQAPLFNRAVQGLYTPGPALGPFLLAAASGKGTSSPLPKELSYPVDGEQGAYTLRCARTPASRSWEAMIASGCPGAVAALGKFLGVEEVLNTFEALGLFTAPVLPLPAASSTRPASSPDPEAAALGLDMQVSPLQMALAAAALSAAADNGGAPPAPLLVSGVNTPQAGWVIPSNWEQKNRLPGLPATGLAANALAVETTPYWESLAIAPSGQEPAGSGTVSWYLGGTIPGWEGSPLAVAIVIEEENPQLAMQIGQSLLDAALQP